MFSLIVAIDDNFNIGKNGRLPWDCPEDLEKFKELTTGDVIIMGRKTYESIGRALPNRVNIVISKSLLVQTVDKNAADQIEKNTDKNAAQSVAQNAIQSVAQNATQNTVKIFADPWDVVRYCDKNERGKEWFVIGGAAIYEWFWNRGLIYNAHVTHISGSHENCDVKFKLLMSEANIIYTDVLSKKATYRLYRSYNDAEQNCLNVIKEILATGNKKSDRTGVGTMSIFGRQLRFDLRHNTFPLMTSRKMFLRGIFAELMLFIRGQTNNQILEEQKINIWAGNTSRKFLDSCGLNQLPVGDMGASYGFLFRHFGAKYKTCLDNYKGQGIDQLANVINTLKTNPNDRRMIISLWNPSDLQNCPLPPCLYNYQFYVHNKQLYCMMTQRSSDFVVAGGWNVATGALLTYLIAAVCDLTPGELIWNIGDIHVYNNIISQAELQITRTPMLYPKLFVKKRENIEDYEFNDLELLCYDPYPAINLVMNP